MMQTSDERHGSAGFPGFYNQPLQEIDSYYSSPFQIVETHAYPRAGSQGTTVSFEPPRTEFFTLESCPSIAAYSGCSSPSIASGLSNRNHLSPQISVSCLSDPHHSSDNNYGSPASASSVGDNGNEQLQQVRRMAEWLLSESDTVNSSYNCPNSEIYQPSSMWSDSSQIKEFISRSKLRDVLILCAQEVYHAETVSANYSTARNIIQELEPMVSVFGEPIQRLGAYVLEGLKARIEHSGTHIYKMLKCEEPTSSELMSYMSILFQHCPYWKFAYKSSNVVIAEAMAFEPIVHIIDFQIAQGTQWMLLMQALANRPGGPPIIRITGVDDSQSAHARGGGLDIVGQRLSDVARKLQIKFEFHAAGMSGYEVKLENLSVRPGEAVAVNFPYILHHMPDESVSTENHRDRLLRLVKSLSPKVVTIVEQESNTNTSPFHVRFTETLDYYTAMFESIDVAFPRSDKQRVRAEENCVARDIVNMIACEGAERVERHEPLGKWIARLSMAGFTQYPLGNSVFRAVEDLLKEYDKNYRLEWWQGALILGWKNRAMATASAWL